MPFRRGWTNFQPLFSIPPMDEVNGSLKAASRPAALAWWRREATFKILAVALLLTAGWLRLSHPDWDGYNHYHPDERFISWVATSIEWPDDLSSALNPRASSLNPYYWPADASSPGLVLPQDTPRRFAYGHLPLYLGVAASRVLEAIGGPLVPALPDDWLLTRDILNGAGWNEYRHITIAGRLLVAMADLGVVALTIRLGRTLYGPAAGLLAGLFVTLTVMHIQLSRFYTVDPFLTLFVVAAIAALVAAARAAVPRRRARLTLLAGALIGLAIGSKFTGAVLFLPLVVTVWLDETSSPRRRVLLSASAVAVALVAFVATNPYAVLDFTCDVRSAALDLGPLRIPPLDWNSCYLENVVAQATMVGGSRDVPYTRQYIGTTPYLYFVEMQLKWGMGLPLGIAGFAGLGWAIWRPVRRADTASWRPRLARLPATEVVILAWAVPFFVLTGRLDVKFMRYLQPLTPFLAVYAAGLLLAMRRPALRRTAIATVAAGTALYALAFVGLYRQPHPWSAASRWFYEHVPSGSVVLSEAWDDTLPDAAVIAGERRTRAEFVADEVNWLDGIRGRDDRAKLEANLERVAAADYLVLASNRNYGVISRLPELYPLSSQYYPLLFGGALGFEPVYANTRTPELAGVHLKTDTFGWPGLRPPDYVRQYLDGLPGIDGGRADESFTVYDQPLVMVFENTGRLTADEMASLFQVEALVLPSG